jgi:hypothetical protein
LRNTPGCRWDAGELKLAKFVVVPGPCHLSLKHLDQPVGMIVRVCGKDLLLSIFASLGHFSTLLNRLHALPEEFHVELIKPGPGDGGVVIISLKG